MKTKFKLLFALFISFNAHSACQFSDGYSKVYSLSGPVTMVFKELGLIKSPKLKGISTFHAVSSEEFAGTYLPGGIFLSREMLKEFSGGILFYDESRELKKNLSSTSLLSTVEILTRNLTPSEVTETVIKQILPYLKDCDNEISKLSQSTSQVEQKIISQIKGSLSAIFFLGEISNGKYPGMVMVNDGVVKWLVGKGKLKTYPSELAYVNWSAKVIHSLPKETYKIGLKDSGKELIKKIHKNPRNLKEINVTYPGILIPGISQLKGTLFLLEAINEI